MTEKQFDVEAFIAQFPLLAQAPNGIANLRGMILQLAIQGKLSKQNIDESVNINVTCDKKLLYKKGKALQNIKDNELLFSIPNNWCWMRLGGIGHNFGQETPRNDFTYIDVSTIDRRNGTILSPEVLSSDSAPSRARKLVKKGTLIYSTVRPYLLNIAVIDKEFSPKPIVSTAFAIIHPFEGIHSYYLYFYLKSPSFTSYVERFQKGVAYPAINDTNFFRGICPIPPLEEQKRIVAKVDELMALCDQLEAQQDAQSHNLLKASKASAQALIQPDDDHADTFQQQWQRIAKHFNTLYGSNSPLPADMQKGKLKNRTVALENILELRLLIMGLGVSGRLLEQILTTKEELENAFQTYKQDILSRVTGTEKRRLTKQFSTSTNLDDFKLVIPNHWLALELGNVSLGLNYGTSSKSQPNGKTPVLRMGNIQNGAIDWSNLVFSDNVEDNEKYRLETGDVLFNRTNSPELVGKTAVFDGLKGAIYAGYLIKVSCAKQMLNPSFLSLCLNSAYGRNWRQSVKSDGVSQSNINAKKLANFIVPIPPLEEQEAIVSKVDELMKLCDQLESLLDEQRQVAQDFSESATKQLGGW